MNRLLETKSSLKCKISKDEIRFHGDLVANDPRLIRDLSQILHGINLASVTFKNKITEKEMSHFLQFVIENRFSLRLENDPVVSLFRKRVPSITLKLTRFKEALKHPVRRGADVQSGKDLRAGRSKNEVVSDNPLFFAFEEPASFYAQDNPIKQAEIDQDLSVILLEILEHPIGNFLQTEKMVLILKNLLVQGEKDKTTLVLIRALQTLVKHCQSGTNTEQASWRK